MGADTGEALVHVHQVRRTQEVAAAGISFFMSGSANKLRAKDFVLHKAVSLPTTHDAADHVGHSAIILGH